MPEALRQHILILSAGRRVSLLRGFKEASRGKRQVFAADMAPHLSAACQCADAHFTLPPVTAKTYPEALSALCRAEKIGLVIPTIDTELPVLATLRTQFAKEGTEIVVSDETLIAACADKRCTGALFDQHQLPVPKVFTLENLCFPALVKPYDGALSKGLKLLKSRDDLTQEIRDNPKNMYCEYIDHATHQEFTLDLYYDQYSTLKCVVPRRRLEVRGGEVAKAVAEKNELVALLFNRLGTLKGARGCLTLQLFRHHSTHAIWAIEINPRFGGGYPLSRHAGVDFQRWLIAEYLEGKSIERFENWQDQTMMLRYDAEVIVNANQGI